MCVCVCVCACAARSCRSGREAGPDQRAAQDPPGGASLTHARTRTRVRARTRTHVHIHARTHPPRTRDNTRTHAIARARTYAPAHTHQRTHARAHARTHARTHPPRTRANTGRKELRLHARALKHLQVVVTFPPLSLSLSRSRSRSLSPSLSPLLSLSPPLLSLSLSSSLPLSLPPSLSLTHRLPSPRSTRGRRGRCCATTTPTSTPTGAHSPNSPLVKTRARIIVWPVAKRENALPVRRRHLRAHQPARACSPAVARELAQSWRHRQHMDHDEGIREPVKCIIIHHGLYNHSVIQASRSRPE